MASVSFVASREEVPAENRNPVGVITRRSVTLFAASRYFDSSAGDITSAAPTLVKPSPAAPSTGNSRAGLSDGTPVKSRRVYVYS